MRQSVFLFIAILGMGFWSCSDDQMEERFISDTKVTSENPITKSAQEGLNVKAMTFNVRVYSPGDGNNNWPNRKNVAAQIIKNEAVDVIGTQEMSWTLWVIDQFNDLKTLLNPDYGSYGHGRDEGWISDENIAIFYKKNRFTLIDSGVFWLSQTPNVKSIGWDAAYRRIAVWTILEDKTGGQRFFAINTHLDNAGATARLESAKLILNKIESLSGGLPVILMGDFNSVSSAAPVQYLVNTSNPNYLLHAKDAAGIQTGPNWTIHDFGATPVNQRIFIDYIFVNQQSVVTSHNVLPEKLNNIYLSDHCPVTAEILLVNP